MLYLKGTRIMMFQLSGFYYRRFRGQVYEECLRRIQVYKLGCLACDGASFVGLRIAVVFYCYGHDDDEEEDHESSIVIIVIIIVPVILVKRGCGISHPEKQNTVHKKHRPPQHTFLYQSYCCYYCHHYYSIVVVLLLLRLLFVKGLGF